jgi:hypothetical protein
MKENKMEKSALGKKCMFTKTKILPLCTLCGSNEVKIPFLERNKMAE